MTTDKIVSLLKESAADMWTVSEKETEALEFYFIRHKLDQNRRRSVKHVTVTVFVVSEDKSTVGSASQEIYTTSTEDEAKKVIDSLLMRAKYAKNPYFTLQPKTDVPVDTEPLEDIDPEKIAKDFIEALSDIDETKTEDINSYEIFVEKNRRRFINSEGVNVFEEYPYSMAEVIINARDEKHEIELYRMYKGGLCDRKYLKEEIEKTLKTGRDRLVTKPLQNLGSFDVVFSNENSKEIYSWYIARLSAAMKFHEYSDFETGKKICEDAAGDKVTIKALKKIENSSENHLFDIDGSPTRDLVLMEENVPKSFYGNRQFAYYLGLKDSFLPKNFEATGGKTSLEELRSGDYLEIMELSDFQVHVMSGDIAGEIRLAYLHKDGEVIPVSGGSVSGNMNDVIKTIRFSKELKTYDCGRCPAVTRLYNVSITGAE